jgi:membrane protein
MKPIESLQATLNDILQFPWRQMLRMLWQRFREVRLGMTASSLTFTTVLALVPLFTLALAIFTVFPIFAQVQDQLQRWLIESLVPESISRQVLGSLTQFSRKASRLGLVGLIAVVVTSLALLVTIDRTLGQIWRVNRQRPWGQRVLLYWAGITLGPLLLGGSLAISSYLFTGTCRAWGIGCQFQFAIYWTWWSFACWSPASQACTTTCPTPASIGDTL